MLIVMINYDDGDDGDGDYDDGVDNDEGSRRWSRGVIRDRTEFKSVGIGAG